MTSEAPVRTASRRRPPCASAAALASAAARSLAVFWPNPLKNRNRAAPSQRLARRVRRPYAGVRRRCAQPACGAGDDTPVDAQVHCSEPSACGTATRFSPLRQIVGLYLARVPRSVPLLPSPPAQAAPQAASASSASAAMVLSRIVVRAFDRRASRGVAASLRVRRDRGKRGLWFALPHAPSRRRRVARHMPRPSPLVTLTFGPRGLHAGPARRPRGGLRRGAAHSKPCVSPFARRGTDGASLPRACARDNPRPPTTEPTRP